MNPLSDQDLIEAYLDGELDLAQIKTLEQRLRSEPALADALLHLAREEAILTEWACAGAAGAREERLWRLAESLPPVQGRLWLHAAFLVMAAAVLIGFLIGLPGPSPTPIEGEAFAKLEDVHGEVYVVPEGGARVAAQPGQTLRRGERVVTEGEGSFAVVAFADKNRLELGNDTIIKLPTDRPQSAADPMRVVLEEGTVAADAAKLLVSTPGYETKILESRAQVTSFAKGTRIEQEKGADQGKGKVQLTRNSDGQSVEIPTGFYVVAPAGAVEKFTPQPMPPAVSEARLVLKDLGAQSLAYSPDGSILAVGCADGHLKLLNSAGAMQLPSLKVSRRLVRAIAYSPDGSLLATAGEEKVVKFWATASLSEQALLKNYKLPILCLTFAPDGTMVASGGGAKNPEIKVWNVAARLEMASLTGHANAVLAIAFSPDSRTLATASRDGTVKLWDLASRQERISINAHASAVSGLAFAPDGMSLATAGKDLIVKLWDPATGALQRSFQGLTGEVRAVAFSPDGRLLAAADGNVKLWSLTTGQPRLTLKAPRPIAALAFNPDGKEIAAVGVDKVVRLWDVPEGP